MIYPFRHMDDSFFISAILKTYGIIGSLYYLSYDRPYESIVSRINARAGVLNTKHANDYPFYNSMPQQ